MAEVNQRPLKLVMTGGGSGGHITPILAVADQLKQLQPSVEIIYIGQTGDSLGDIPAQHPAIDQVYTVRAGKLRRYHGEGWRQLLDLPTMAKNIRDVSYVFTGLLQSYRLLRRLRPDAIFVKGGFVGVPVGLAAAWLKIPYVTHDSDALPGLANRIIARWARLHTVALPKEVYAYPANKTLTVGVPISQEFRLRNDQELDTLKKSLGIADSAQVVLVTGGGLGAQRLNRAMLTISQLLLDAYPDLQIIHAAGRSHETTMRHEYDRLLTPVASARVQVVGFVTNLYAYAAVADVVVTRAGGNSLAELAALARPCIVIPNPVLTGGHQLKNAKVLADRQAVAMISEESIAKPLDQLLPAIQGLLDDPATAKALASRFHEFAQPDAARQLAVVLLEQAKKHDI